VLENLRQICVWAQANATSAIDGGAQWWAYAHLFTTNCHTEATWTPDCSYAAMRSVGIDDAAARACVAASNASAAACEADPSSPSPICALAPYTNMLLQDELDLWADQGGWILPSARVEDVLVVGGMSPRTVLGAICSAFPPAPAAGQVTAPPACGCLLQPTDAALQACAAGAGAPAAKTPGWAIALGVVGALGAVAAGAAIWWVRRTRVEMRAEMEDYMALAGAPKEGAAGGGGGLGAAAPASTAWVLPSFFGVPRAGSGGGGWQRVPGEGAQPPFAAGGPPGGSLNNLPPAATDL
jgi:hypothetical protein